jgi:uncharacterized protein (DUF302 family)
MVEESATNTYLVAAPFDQAVKVVRKILSGANLRITGELNMSGRIQRALLIHTAPCVVLFASPATDPENFAGNPSGAALIPLHIVISARGTQTEVHVLRALPRDDGTVDRRMTAATRDLQTLIGQAIETIGMRASLGV